MASFIVSHWEKVSNNEHFPTLSPPICGLHSCGSRISPEDGTNPKGGGATYFLDQFSPKNSGKKIRPRGATCSWHPHRSTNTSCLNITRMHSSRMHTARSSSHLPSWGVSTRHPPGPYTPPPVQAPLEQPPWDQAPPGPGTPQDQAPPGPSTPQDQAPPPVNRMINRCKNTTLLQTSFVGGGGN